MSADTFSAPDGTRLAYTRVGSGPLLVCVPGGPGRAAAYLEDLGGLADERTLVLLDMRATGRSEIPADPSTLRFDRLADDVEALREHLGEPRIDLLGHSAGSVVAQAYASAHPDRLRSLLLVTPVDVLQRGPAARADVPAIRAARAGEPWYPEAAEAQAALADAAPAQQQALQRATRPFYYGRWDERTQTHAASADRQMSPRAELGFAVGGETVDVPALVAGLGRVDVPVLVVGAERDGATGVEAVHTVAACFPRARTAVLPRAGHFPWVDEPEAFRAAVGEFLRGTAQQPRPRMRSADVSLPLRVTLDAESDAAYVFLTEIEAGAAVTQRVVGVAGKGDVVLDFDAAGRLLGVEVVGAGSLLPLELLDRVAGATG